MNKLQKVVMVMLALFVMINIMPNRLYNTSAEEGHIYRDDNNVIEIITEKESNTDNESTDSGETIALPNHLLKVYITIDENKIETPLDLYFNKDDPGKTIVKALEGYELESVILDDVKVDNQLDIAFISGSEETKVLNVSVKKVIEQHIATAISEKTVDDLAEDTVATIGDAQYKTLKDAIDNANADDKIVLQKDISESILVDKTIQIDVNGKTWTGSGASVITVKKGSLALNDNTKTGVIQSAEGYRVITANNNNNESISIQNLRLEGNEKGVINESQEIYKYSSKGYLGGIIFYNGGTLKVDNVQFVNGKNIRKTTSDICYGGAIYAKTLTTANTTITLEVKNSSFDNCYAQTSGDAIASNVTESVSQEFHMILDNVDFQNNNGTKVVYLNSQWIKKSQTVDITLNELNFKNNKAESIYYKDFGQPDDVITVTNCDFSENKNTVIDLVGGAMNVKNSKFIRNSSTNDNIVCASKSTLTLDNCEFNENKSVYSPVNMSNTNLVSKKTNYLGNTATNGNGGALAVDGGSLNIDEGIFEGNTATNGFGGAISVSDSYGEMKVDTKINATIKDNIASKSGGGIYFSHRKTNSQKYKLILSGNLENNIATNKSGGGIYFSSKDLECHNLVVKNNTANLYGGGLYLCTSTVKGSYHFGENVYVYANASNEPKRIEREGYSSEIFVRNTNVDTDKAVKYKADINVDAICSPYTDEETGLKYELTRKNYGGNSKPTKYYDGYYSKVTVPVKIYLSSDGTHQDSPDDRCYGVQTISDAINKAKELKENKIYVCGTYELDNDAAKLINESGLKWVRCDEHQNHTLFNIKGDVTLNGAQISGNNSEATVSLIAVKNGNHLTIIGDTVIENGNATYGGAIYVFNGGRMDMTGGIIRKNHASKNGGAVYVEGKGAIANFDGGELSKNSADNYGGAVNARVGAVVNFGTNGGRTLVKGNTSVSEGAGICYEGVDGGSTGFIYKATFTENVSTLNFHFVSGAAVSVQKGATVKMKNVYVTNNHGEHYGNYGALYTCPTGETVINKIEGALIVDNYAQGSFKAPDIVHSHNNEFDNGENQMFVSNYALGGGEIEWRHPSSGRILESGEYQYTTNSFEMRAFVSNETKSWAKEKAEKDGVVITNNTGYGPGSAIANNGVLIIGTDDESLHVKKQWDEADTEHPAEVLMYLTRNGKLVDTDTRKDAYVVLNEKNNWSYTWENLGDGEKWEVQEASVTGYDTNISERKLIESFNNNDINDSITSVYEIVVTNKKSEKKSNADLTLEKKLFASDMNKKFVFTMNIGKDIAGKYSYYTTDAQGNQSALHPIYSDGLIFELGNNEKVTICGLEKGTSYDVAELGTNDYMVYVTHSEDDITESNRRDHHFLGQVDESGSIKENENGEVQNEYIRYTNIEKTTINISKELLTYNETLKGATFVFEVKGVDTEGKVVYHNLVDFMLDDGSLKAVEVEIPLYEGVTYSVSEIYNGSSYESVGDNTITFDRNTLKDQLKEVVYNDKEISSLHFVNDYNNENINGSGVVNDYSYGNGEYSVEQNFEVNTGGVD